MLANQRVSQRFAYRARDAGGGERSGYVEAADEPSALRKLLDQGLKVIDIKSADSSNRVVTKRPDARRTVIRSADQIVVLRELSTLLQAGVSVAEALPSVADAYDGSALGEVLRKVSQSVNAGVQLTSALSSSGLELPPYAIALVQAGEAAGDLGPALGEAADQLEYERRLAEEMRTALVYPAILVIVGALVITAVFVGVVPRFASLLQNGRADIPEFSRQVIASGVYVKKHLGMFAMSTLALLVAAVGTFSGVNGKRRLLRFAVSVPLLRVWLVESDLGRWAGVFAVLLRNRVGITQAIQLSAAAVRLDFVRNDIVRLSGELGRGRTLADALAEVAWFPRNRLNLVRVGERSAQLSETLATLGAIHSDAARARQRRLLALLEPVAILFIGAVIGFVMVAVMSAITSVNSVGL